MGPAKKELNHAECIERDLKEWKKIFSLSEKAYGYRINSYKGTQKLVYIPDAIDGIKVAFVYDGAFPTDCAVICNKRLWDKMVTAIQVNSAVVYLNKPENYPDLYAKLMRSYISNNKDIVLTRIFEDDSVEAMARFLQAITKITDYKMLDELLIRSDQSSQIRAYLLNLTNNIDSQSKSVENELKKDPFSVTEVKKNWLYKADENGFIVITAYKGAEIQVVIPDRVGKTKVKRIGEYAFSAKRNRATPEQQRSVNQIRSIHVPDGIESLGSGLCQWSMMLTDVFLPGSIKEIGESAFQTYRGLKSIIIHAPAGSYAEQYAKENDIPFIAE